jgi:hypothetical protein
VAKLGKPGSWPGDIIVGAIFLGMVGLISIAMLVMVIGHSAGFL